MSALALSGIDALIRRVIEVSKTIERAETGNSAVSPIDILEAQKRTKATAAALTDVVVSAAASKEEAMERLKRSTLTSDRNPNSNLSSYGVAEFKSEESSKDSIDDTVQQRAAEELAQVLAEVRENANTQQERNDVSDVANQEVARVLAELRAKANTPQEGNDAFATESAPNTTQRVRIEDRASPMQEEPAAAQAAAFATQAAEVNAPILSEKGDVSDMITQQVANVEAQKPTLVPKDAVGRKKKNMERLRRLQTALKALRALKPNKFLQYRFAQELHLHLSDFGYDDKKGTFSSDTIWNRWTRDFIDYAKQLEFLIDVFRPLEKQFRDAFWNYFSKEYNEKDVRTKIASMSDKTKGALLDIAIAPPLDREKPIEKKDIHIPENAPLQAFHGILSRLVVAYREHTLLTQLQQCVPRLTTKINELKERRETDIPNEAVLNMNEQLEKWISSEGIRIPSIGSNTSLTAFIHEQVLEADSIQGSTFIALNDLCAILKSINWGTGDTTMLPPWWVQHVQSEIESACAKIESIEDQGLFLSVLRPWQSEKQWAEILMGPAGRSQELQAAPGRSQELQAAPGRSQTSETDFAHGVREELQAAPGRSQEELQAAPGRLSKFERYNNNMANADEEEDEESNDVVLTPTEPLLLTRAVLLATFDATKWRPTLLPLLKAKQEKDGTHTYAFSSLVESVKLTDSSPLSESFIQESVALCRLNAIPASIKDMPAECGEEVPQIAVLLDMASELLGKGGACAKYVRQFESDRKLQASVMRKVFRVLTSAATVPFKAARNITPFVLAAVPPLVTAAAMGVGAPPVVQEVGVGASLVGVTAAAGVAVKQLLDSAKNELTSYRKSTALLSPIAATRPQIDSESDGMMIKLIETRVIDAIIAQAIASKFVDLGAAFSTLLNLPEKEKSQAAAALTKLDNAANVVLHRFGLLDKPLPTVADDLLRDTELQTQLLQHAVNWYCMLRLWYFCVIENHDRDENEVERIIDAAAEALNTSNNGILHTAYILILTGLSTEQMSKWWKAEKGEQEPRRFAKSAYLLPISIEGSDCMKLRGSVFHVMCTILGSFPSEEMRHGALSGALLKAIQSLQPTFIILNTATAVSDKLPSWYKYFMSNIPTDFMNASETWRELSNTVASSISTLEQLQTLLKKRESLRAQVQQHIDEITKTKTQGGGMKEESDVDQMQKCLKRDLEANTDCKQEEALSLGEYGSVCDVSNAGSGDYGGVCVPTGKVLSSTENGKVHNFAKLTKSWVGLESNALEQKEFYKHELFADLGREVREMKTGLTEIKKVFQLLTTQVLSIYEQLLKSQVYRRKGAFQEVLGFFGGPELHEKMGEYITNISTEQTLLEEAGGSIDNKLRAVLKSTLVLLRSIMSWMNQISENVRQKRPHTAVGSSFEQKQVDDTGAQLLHLLLLGSDSKEEYESDKQNLEIAIRTLQSVQNLSFYVPKPYEPLTPATIVAEPTPTVAGGSSHYRALRSRRLRLRTQTHSTLG